MTLEEAYNEMMKLLPPLSKEQLDWFKFVRELYHESLQAELFMFLLTWFSPPVSMSQRDKIKGFYENTDWMWAT
jgi:hypothetical protein